jgi:STE24 endopeptidase
MPQNAPAHSNAYFTGSAGSSASCFMTSLIAQMTPAEILAVLAHEIGTGKSGMSSKHRVIQVCSFAGLYAALLPGAWQSARCLVRD